MKRRPGATALLLLLLGLALLATPPPWSSAAWSTAAAQGPATEALAEVPEPFLDRMEPAVREQLASARQQLDTLLADGPAAAVGSERAAQLAAAFGELGRLYLVYGLLEPAAAALDNARRLAPDQLGWHYYAGVSLERLGRLEEALAAFETVIERQERALPARLRRGDLLLRLDRPAAAEEAFRRAQELLPGGGRAGADGAEPGAAVGPDSAGRAVPGAAYCHYGLGRARAAQGDAAGAATAFEAALAAQPAASAVRYQLALAYRELGRIDDARQQLELRGEVPALFPDPLMEQLESLTTGAGAHLNRGNLLARRGRTELALEQYRLAVAADPANPSAQQALGMALAQFAGDHAGAVDAFTVALELEPGNPLVEYNLGAALGRLGRPDEALAHYRRAAELAPEMVEAHYALGTGLARAGRHAEALPALERAVELAPRDPDIRFRLGVVLARLESYGAAEETLRQLLADRPGYGQARFWLATALAGQQRYDEAVAEYRQLIAGGGGTQGPDDAGEPAETGGGASLAAAARRGLGRTLLLAGDYPTARRELEAGLEAHPGDLVLSQLLARLLAAAPDPAVRDGSRALTLAQELLQAQPSLAHAETYAMALAELGRHQEAAAMQQQLIDQLASANPAQAAALLPALRRRLELYRQGEACRAPWLGGC